MRELQNKNRAYRRTEKFLNFIVITNTTVMIISGTCCRGFSVWWCREVWPGVTCPCPHSGASSSDFTADPYKGLGLTLNTRLWNQRIPCLSQHHPAWRTPSTGRFYLNPSPSFLGCRMAQHRFKVLVLSPTDTRWPEHGGAALSCTQASFLSHCTTVGALQ